MDGNCYDLVQVQLVGKFSNQTMVLGPVIPTVTHAGRIEVILADNIIDNEIYNITVSDENAEVTEETNLSEFLASWSLMYETYNVKVIYIVFPI